MRPSLPPLPITISLGRPSRAELLVLGGALLLLAAAASLLVSWRQATAPPQATTARLFVSTTPPGARVLIDGQQVGTTPSTLDVAPGPHDLTLSAPHAIDDTEHVDLGPAGATLDVVLWRDRPVIRYLRPALPGALLADALFLDDGQLALSLLLPGGERQAWTLAPEDHFALHRLGELAPRAPLAVRPDGQDVAYLARDELTDGSGGLFLDRDRATSVWLVPASPSAAASQRLWVVPTQEEALVDLVWAPDGRHLLLVARQGADSSATRTSVRSLDIDTGVATDLASLPSEIVPGSYVWSPDGHSVAFIVHTAQLAAVCLLSDAGAFRYLGDLGHDGLAGPPVAPVAWAPEGLDRLVYGALLRQAPGTGTSALGQQPVGLYLVEPPDVLGRQLGGDAGLAPLWRPDGRLLVVGITGGTAGATPAFHLRSLETHGAVQDLATLDLPAPGTTSYGVRWDLPHARALVVTNRSSGDGAAHDFWLLDFRSDATA